MLEDILEMFAYIIIEIIFQGIILGIFGRIFRGIKLLGIGALKLLTLSTQSINELEGKYQDSSKPYFLGFGIAFSFIYLFLVLSDFIW